MALSRSPGASPSSSAGSLIVNHMVIGSMKPLTSSCFTWISDLSGLMASTSPVRGNSRTFAGGGGALQAAASVRTAAGISTSDEGFMASL